MGMVFAASRITARSSSVWPVVPMTRLVPCFNAASTSCGGEGMDGEIDGAGGLGEGGVEILADVVGGGDGHAGLRRRLEARPGPCGRIFL